MILVGMCHGVADYSQYRSSISYNIKRVKLACWPPNTVSVLFGSVGNERDDLLFLQLQFPNYNCDYNY